MVHCSRLSTLLIDVPAAKALSAAAFWSAALGVPAVPVPGEEQFTSLPGAVPGLVTAVQSVEDTPRFHVDLETDDVEVETARLIALGAVEQSRWLGWRTLRVPGGQLVCVIPMHSDLRSSPAPPTLGPAGSTRLSSTTRFDDACAVIGTGRPGVARRCARRLVRRGHGCPVRAVVVSTLVSVDGRHEGPGGMFWLCRLTTDSAPATSSGCELRGRVGRSQVVSGLRELLAGGRRRQDRHGPSNGISRLNGAIEKVVVSDTLTLDSAHPWTATTRVVPKQHAAAALAAMKDSNGGDIVVFGSATTWNALLVAGLVDELRVMIGPALLGAGQRYQGPVLARWVERSGDQTEAGGLLGWEVPSRFDRPGRGVQSAAQSAAAVSRSAVLVDFKRAVLG